MVNLIPFAFAQLVRIANQIVELELKYHGKWSTCTVVAVTFDLNLPGCGCVFRDHRNHLYRYTMECSLVFRRGFALILSIFQAFTWLIYSLVPNCGQLFSLASSVFLINAFYLFIIYPQALDRPCLLQALLFGSCSFKR